MASPEPSTLPTLPHHIGIYKAFVVDHPVTLVITKQASSFRLYKFNIDIIGLAGPGDPQRALLSCSSHLASASGRKVFTVVSTEQRLFTMRKTGSILSRGWLLEGPDGETLVESGVKEAYGQVRFKSTLDTDGEQPIELETKSGKIMWKDTPVAQIRPVKDSRVELLDINVPMRTAKAYSINVAPGIDLTIIAAIIISLYN